MPLNFYAVKHWFKFLTDMPKRSALATIRFYQRVLSPDHGWAKIFFPFGCCKFRPTCSEYSYQAIERFGLIRGLALGSWRLLRCHPWAEGGHDPVPERRPGRS